MPTWRKTDRFVHDYAVLTDEEKRRFNNAVRHFVKDLSRGQFRPGLRVKRIQGTSEIREMTWAPNGRATWQFGDEIKEGETHIIWRRIGGHEVLKEP